MDLHSFSLKIFKIILLEYFPVFYTLSAWNKYSVKVSRGFKQFQLDMIQVRNVNKIVI
jgi:hypothetical protein